MLFVARIITLLGPRLTTLLLAACGVLVMMWGLPRANRYRLPWRWRIGILYIGLGLIFWPAFYLFVGHADLETVWIPIWFATLATFGVGIRRLLFADKFKPGGSYSSPYDVGWTLRPRPENPPQDDLLRDTIENVSSNPFAVMLSRWARRPKSARKDTQAGPSV
jgi:hypothetical protein